MSVILVDLGDDQHDIMINNAGWRRTVELLQPLAVIDDERIQRLTDAWLGVALAPEEAKAIGNALIAGPLSAVHWSDDVYAPIGYWKDPCKHDWREYQTE